MQCRNWVYPIQHFSPHVSSRFVPLYFFCDGFTLWIRKGWIWNSSRSCTSLQIWRLYYSFWGCAIISWAIFILIQEFLENSYLWRYLLMKSCLFWNCHTYSSSVITPSDCKIFRTAAPSSHQSANAIKYMNLPCSEHMYDWQVLPGKIVNSFLSHNCSILHFFFSEFWNWIFSLYSC